MTDIGSKAVQTALREVGTTERRRNLVKYWDVKKSWNGSPWCGAFVVWVWLALGVDIRKVFPNPYSASAIRARAKQLGVWKTSGGSPGDIVIYDFGHIGMSHPDRGATGYRAVEGNTSRGSSGSQANGGGVYVRYRGRRSISGWVDMAKVVTLLGGAKDAVAAAEKVSDAVTGKLDEDGRHGRATSREIQQRLRTVRKGLGVDGRMGPDSWSGMQEFLGTPVDGEVSNQSRKADDLGNGVSSRGWDYDGPGAKGSTMVRHLQAYVGAKVDGIYGPETIRKAQALANAFEAAFTKADMGVAKDRARKAGL